MIRHTVVIKWTAEATPEQKQRVETELARLPALVPTLRRYQFGQDVGVNEASFDFAVTAEFDDVAGYIVYRDHPEHQAIIEKHIAPISVTRSSVQYEFTP